MGDKIKDRKLGSQEEKNMSRLLIKIIWFILGVAALFYGIKGIYFCFTGGTVETLDSSSDGVGGFFGLLWCFYYIGIGLFVLIGIKEIREKKKKKNETEENKAEEKEEEKKKEESLMDSPYCRWWKDDLGYHNEHHPFTGYVQGSWDGICLECGKKIEYLKVK